MGMNLIIVDKNKGEIEKLNQLLEDRYALIEELKVARGRLVRGRTKLKITLEGPSNYSSQEIMHLNQHIIDALDTKAMQFIEEVYKSALTNIEQEIERISEEVMYNLIKANQ